MTQISITKLYDLLSLKIGKETAESLTNFIEQKIKEELEDRSQILATKEDIRNLDVKISETKTEMVRWMFAFWVTIVLFLLLFLFHQ